VIVSLVGIAILLWFKSTLSNYYMKIEKTIKLSFSLIYFYLTQVLLNFCLILICEFCVCCSSFLRSMVQFFFKFKCLIIYTNFKLK
jgi:hypothetical protein